MRKAIAIVLLAALLLCGCAEDTPEEDTVLFFYPRTQILYGDTDGIIAPETQLLPSGLRPFEWMLRDYFNGPDSPELYSPFPPGTTLLGYRVENGSLILDVSSHFFSAEGISRTLSCAALARTCFELTAAQRVIICAPGEQQITVDRNTFVYSDVSDEIHMTIGTEAAG